MQQNNMSAHQKAVMQEANKVFSILSQRVLEATTLAPDPTVPEIQELTKSISSQWKLFCLRKGLSVESYTAIQKYGDDLIADYNRFQAGEQPTTEVVAEEKQSLIIHP